MLSDKRLQIQLPHIHGRRPSNRDEKLMIDGLPLLDRTGDKNLKNNAVPTIATVIVLMIMKCTRLTRRLLMSLPAAFMLLFLLLGSTSSIFAKQLDLGYSVIEQTGKFCPGRDSCRQGRGSRGPGGIENDWKKRNCFCDDDCSVYGDCCIDANKYVQDEQKVNHLSFECANLKQYGDIYMSNKCPESWQEEGIREACEARDQVSDPFGTTPVTSVNSGFTYRNYYCAVCNKDSLDIKFWRPRLECPTLTGYSNRFKNITKDYIEANLTLSDDKHWGVFIDTNGVPVFHECYIDPAVPDTLTHMIRSCSGKSTVTTCPKTYTLNNTIAELCLSYTAMVFEPNAAYRNVHCAICNNASLDKLICLNLGPFGRFNWQQNFNSFSFAVLFDLGGNAGDSVGFVKSGCKTGELYDPFFKKCRNVICGDKGAEYRAGRCISPNSYRTTTATTTTTTTVTTTTTTSTASTSLQSTTAAFSRSTSTVTTVTSTTSATSKPAAYPSNPGIRPSWSSPTSETVITTTPTTPAAVSELSSTTQEAIPTEEHKHHHEVELPKDDNFVDCPKFELQVGEFKMMENEHKVYVEKYDKVLEEGEFSMNGESLVVCVFQEYTEEISKFGPQMGYVTLICSGISVICLLIHTLASCVSPELQNLSGKNLLSLTLALMGGYLCFIAAMFNVGNGGTSGCKSLAVLMYFFFLASFVWMMVIAFDVCRTLKMATSQLRITSGSQWKKFGLYSAFGWGVPIIASVITVTIDGMEDLPPEYRPGFGTTDLCWFSNKMGLLIYFAVPFAGIMGVNIFLFVFSACLVFDTTRSTAKMTTTCGPKTNFKLYLRLALIMGITWVTGLAAGFVDVEAVWYVFVALNTLQGLFIFVAFTCTKKVMDSLCGSSAPRSHPVGGGGSSDSSNSVMRSWRGWSRDSSNLSKKTTSTVDLSPDRFDDPAAVQAVPSRYGSRGKTMYTVSKYQASTVSQNSFDGRYY